MKESYKLDFLHAGKLAGQVRAFGKELIVPGASYNDVIKKIRNKIVELGGKEAFPPQIALNHVAAHFLPQPDQDIIFKNEVIKLDVGVCYRGCIGDCAVTVDLSGKYQSLIDAAESALAAAEKSIRVGISTREIGKIIEDTIATFGYKPIKNLTGHGLGFNRIHTPPSFPNFDDRSARAVIAPGMTFAIEPFATDGKGYIYESGFPAIFSFIGSKNVASMHDNVLLKKIIAFDGLPFAIHDLMDCGLKLIEVKKSLGELLKKGILAGYGALIEEGRGIVAQAENSILVDNDGQVFISTRL